MTSPFVPGDVIIAELPISGRRVKSRPAIVLKIVPPYDDFLVCGISTQLARQVQGLDETIVSTDPDYANSGLQDDSLIRLGYLTTLSLDDIDGGIGDISKVRLERLLRQLAKFITSM